MAALRSVSRYHWLVLALAYGGEFSNSLASQAIAPLAPLFQLELGLSKAEVGFFSSATLAGAWGMLFITGSLTDRFGVRRILSIGEIVVGLLMLSMSMVGSFLQAAAVMFTAGLGRSATGTAPTKAVSEWFPPRNRGTIMGIKQTAMPAAGIVTASTLPAIGLVWGWRSAVALTGFLIVLAGIATAGLYRAPADGGRAPQPGSSVRKSMSEVIGNGYLWRLSIMNLLTVTVQFALTTYLVLYFDEVVLVPWVPDKGSRIVAAGGYLALCQVGGVFGRLFWGVVSDRVFDGQRVVVLAVGGFLLIPLCVATAYLSSYPLWLVTAIVFALGSTVIGMGSVYQTLVTETVGRKYAATAVGFSMTVSQVGKVVGPPMFGFVVDLAGSYQLAWNLLSVLSVGGALMAVWNIKGEKHVA